MARHRIRLSSKWPTLAGTARVFKLSAATQRRISREVEEFPEKHKDVLAAAKRRGTVVKSDRRVARKAAHRPARVSHAR